MENAVKVVLSFSFLANFPQVVNKLIKEDNLDLFLNLSTAFYFMHKLNYVEKNNWLSNKHQSTFLQLQHRHISNFASQKRN